MAEYLADHPTDIRYQVETISEPRLTAPGTGPGVSLPAELEPIVNRFLNLRTREEILSAFSETGAQFVGRPPIMSRVEREALKQSWGFTTEEEVDEALALSGLVTIMMGDVAGAARTARHPLSVAKALVGAGGALETHLREVVPILRERGCSWSEIGAALGTSKQSAWERFSGEK